jgi:hypothetical protein
MERLDGETILINFDSGEYFSFEGPAADILWLIDTGVAEAVWGGIFAEYFPGFSHSAQVDLDVRAFLSELVAAGIISESEGVEIPTGSLPDDYVRSAWTAPRVTANDDLADLLLIDPIHDASDDGWPGQRSDPA